VLQPIVNQQVQHVLAALDEQVQKASSEESEGSPEPEPDGDASGAEEGVSPLSPETYEPEPEGPTTSTED
jgi:hypothetical protein